MTNLVRTSADRIKQMLGKPGLFAMVFCTIALIHIIRVEYNAGGESSPAEFVFGSILSLLFVFCLARICENIPYALPRTIISVLFFFIFCGLNAYRISNGVSLDYALVVNNLGLSFSSEAITVILSVFHKLEMVIWFASAPASAAIVCIGTRKSKHNDSRAARILLYLSIAFITCILPVTARDEISSFIKGGIAHGAVHKITVNGKYPLLRESISRSAEGKILSAKSDRPNVFIIMVESFNANFVESRYTDGTEYTPFFNSLIPQGLYIERFYGNSVQTCKGQEATFFSIIPSMNGKLFVSFPDINIEGFPAILGRNNYRTHFFQAYHNLKFDNTQHAMKKAGFAEIHSFMEFKRKEDTPRIWNWGVEDGTFYERFFEYLDEDHTVHPGSPVFAALATVGTHIPCTGMPDYPDRIIRKPENIRERYINALHLSDSQLKIFFRELEKRKYLSNSIVIITADHSFPMKEHGIYNNEICRYEESFRIPFLVLWKGKITPDRVRERPYSQLDIGSTLCDIIGIKDELNTMCGISIYDRTTPHPVELVQPYNGLFLEAIAWPYKYVKHLSTHDEFLYNLESDPAEAVNLASKDRDRVMRMRPLLDPVFITQKVIEENRVRK